MTSNDVDRMWMHRALELARRAEHEAEVPVGAVVVQDGRRLELDVIDVAEIDEQGRVLSMRAFFDLEGARELA